MLQNNPYNVLSETISFENVQQIGELITLKCLRGYCAYSRRNFEHLYTGYVRDLNRRNSSTHTFSCLLLCTNSYLFLMRIYR